MTHARPNAAYHFHGRAPEIVPKEIGEWNVWFKISVLNDGARIIKYEATLQQVVVEDAHRRH